MRIFELFTGLLVVAASLALTGQRSRPAGGGLWLAACIGFLLHFGWEGPRLQAAPIYVALILVGFGSLLLPVGGIQRLALVFAMGFAVLGLFVCWLIPVFHFPEPDGPFPIGTTTVYLTDWNRKEPYAATPDQKRRFALQIWYPATDVKKNRRAPYREGSSLSWKSRYQCYIQTHSAVDDSPRELPGGWPVVFFSPSSGGYRSQNTFLTESLVSHGYVVIAFDHPDTCSRVAFPDGTVMHSLPDVWLDLRSERSWKASLPKTESILTMNVQDMQYTYNQLLARQGSRELVELARYMDLSRIAAIGHSFGGAAAAELCRTNQHFRAGINMDGWMFHGVEREGVATPFLFMIEDDPLWFDNKGPFGTDEAGVVHAGTLEYHTAIRHSVTVWGGTIARVVGAAHSDFSDISLYLRPIPWNPKPLITPADLHTRIKMLVLAFLDQELKGDTTSMARAQRALTGIVEIQHFERPANITSRLQQPACSVPSINVCLAEGRN